MWKLFVLSLLKLLFVILQILVSNVCVIYQDEDYELAYQINDKDIMHSRCTIRGCHGNVLEIWKICENIEFFNCGQLIQKSITPTPFTFQQSIIP